MLVRFYRERASNDSKICGKYFEDFKNRFKSSCVVPKRVETSCISAFSSGSFLLASVLFNVAENFIHCVDVRIDY